jgi:hypothetical protein
MPIDVQRRRDRRVAEPILEHLQMDTLGDEQRVGCIGDPRLCRCRHNRGIEAAHRPTLAPPAARTGDGSWCVGPGRPVAGEHHPSGVPVRGEVLGELVDKALGRYD